jgi:hypothetical protein
VTSLILSGANYIKKDTRKGYQASKIAMGEEKKKKKTITNNNNKKLHSPPKGLCRTHSPLLEHNS